MIKESRPHSPQACTASIAAVKDALYVLNGKWKLPLIVALLNGPKRFKEIQRSLSEITPKVLSKELRELELNGFLERKVFNTIPVAITYELTPYSESLDGVIESLRLWGEQHRLHLVEKRRLE
ncbi:MAG: winged helix-turn-helix transcriptional regulator [Janthinobacterium lividum]